jgi:hypothetical protein
MLRRIHNNNLSSKWAQYLINGSLAYRLLRDTEPNPQIRAALNGQIANFVMSLARQEANHGHYGHSLYHYFMALFTEPRLKQLYRTLHGTARTLAIAMQLHRVADD